MSSPDISQASNDTGTGPRLTQVFLNSRREAIVIFGSWFVALCWAVPYCYINGYGHLVDPETMSTTMGIPTWLFGGILLPWIIADLFTTWVCFFFMKDDKLGAAGDEETHAEPVAVTGAEGGAA